MAFIADVSANKLVYACGYIPVGCRLYSLQQRHLYPGDNSLPESGVEEPFKPNWLTVQNGQNVGSVLIIMIPYLDADLLRVYASSDPRLVVASSHLPQQTVQELFGSIDENFIGCGNRSILRTVAGSKIPVRPPRLASPPYCSIVQVR